MRPKCVRAAVDRLAQAGRVRHVGDECRGLHAGVVKRAQVPVVTRGGAGDEADGVSLGAEAVSHRHAKAGADADDDEDGLNRR
jgi:hypothetical protein